MRNIRACWVCLSCLIVMMGCTYESDIDNQNRVFSDLESRSQKVVYGDDSRLEYYQLAEGDVMKKRVLNSTGLLIRPSKVTIQGQRVILDNSTLGTAQQLCENEQFQDQPEPGHCSGTLIDNDLFLTAGHCVDDVADCANTRIIFRSMYTALNELYPTTIQDLYSCSEIITRRNDGGGDYAVIRLDRMVTGGLEPAPVWNGNNALEVGTPLTLIGGPNGIPVKTDKEGRVISSGSDSRITFGVTVDAFGGNSGSGLYSDDGTVVGILVQGRRDYYFDQSSSCRRVAQIDVNSEGQPIDNGGGETGTYVARALADLCLALPEALACGGMGSTGPIGGAEMGGIEMGGAEMGGAEMGGAEMGGAEMGGMDLCQDEQEEDDTQQQAHSSTLNQFVNYNFCDDATDWIRFELNEGDSIDLETYSITTDGVSSRSETDTVLSIHDSMSRVLIEDDDGGSGRASLIQGWVAPNTGTYNAKIRSYGSSTGEQLKYRLLLRNTCAVDEYEVINAFTNASDERSQLQDDRPVAESLFGEELSSVLPIVQDRTLCDEDWLPVRLNSEILVNEPTLIVQTRLNGSVESRADTILSLYGPNGELIEENDDRSGNDRSSLVELAMTSDNAGLYWVRVRSYGGKYDGTKNYQISVSFAETCDEIDNDIDGVIDEGLANCLVCEPDLYEDNDEFNQAQGFSLGYITEVNHCLDSNDYYRFNLNADQKIDIETYVQRESDTVITLYSSGGEVLADNDDRQQNQLASLIEGFVAPMTNTYRLFVRQFNRRIGPERPYHLLIRTACSADVYEHDDQAIEARLLTLTADENIQEDATLCDEDWRRVTLEKGQWIDLQLSAEDLSADRAIEVLISKHFGAQVLMNEQTNDVGESRFSFEATDSGDYWILLRASTQYYGGDFNYSLTLATRPIDRCDGSDNDLDGVTDEGVLNACGTCGDVPSEICNGIDDDCDGQSDEGTFNACGECGDVPSEICNGIDDDCDGQSDEGTLNACGECGDVPSEVCNELDDDCDGDIDETVLNACGYCGDVPDELCNGNDDDCDGDVDEDVLNACGACGDVPSQDLCNGNDDDCDGQSDEDCEMSGGESSGGESSGGESSGGESSGGESSGGESSGGESSGGESSGGESSGGQSNFDDVTVIVGGSEEALEVNETDPADTLTDSQMENDLSGRPLGCAGTSVHHKSISLLILMLLWSLWGIVMARRTVVMHKS